MVCCLELSPEHEIRTGPPAAPKQKIIRLKKLTSQLLHRKVKQNKSFFSNGYKHLITSEQNYRYRVWI